MSAHPCLHPKRVLFYRNKAIYCFGGDGDGDDIDGGHEGRLRPSARHVRPSDAAAARPRVSFLFPSDFVIEKTQTISLIGKRHLISLPYFQTFKIA